MGKAYIILEDGSVFEGLQTGAACETVGELVFTTGMCGFTETLTDPSYGGQIVMQTFPLIGNYGYISSDCESSGCYVNGYITHELCDTPSNFRCESTIDDFLKENNIPGVCAVDTRALTLVLREKGTMNAAIVSELPQDVSAFAEKLKYHKNDLSSKNVGVKEAVTIPSNTQKPFRVALMDFGTKNSTVDTLLNIGCEVTKLPCDTSAEEILSSGFDGVVLSEGPGNPADYSDATAEIAKLAGNIPVFAISLGHQLLALSLGGKTEKLKYGHRGASQPVKDLSTGKVHITLQNHGFTVLSEGLTADATISFLNANDGTVEGIDYHLKKAFSVQFDPNAKDTAYLFERFIKLMEDNANADR